MTATLTIVAAAAVMVGAGVFLMLERSLTRVLVGLVMLSNGVNVMLISASGRAGEAPLYGEAEPAAMSDALPQALVLTAIVITLGAVTFLLAMAYRSWQLHDHDDVQDDQEDAIVRRRAEDDESSDLFDVERQAAFEPDDEEVVAVPREDHL